MKISSVAGILMNVCIVILPGALQAQDAVLPVTDQLTASGTVELGAGLLPVSGTVDLATGNSISVTGGLPPAPTSTAAQPMTPPDIAGQSGSPTDAKIIAAKEADAAIILAKKLGLQGVAGGEISGVSNVQVGRLVQGRVRVRSSRRTRRAASTATPASSSTAEDDGIIRWKKKEASVASN